MSETPNKKECIMGNINKIAYTQELTKYKTLLLNCTDKNDINYYKTNIKNLEYRINHMEQ